MHEIPRACSKGDIRNRRSFCKEDRLCCTSKLIKKVFCYLVVIINVQTRRQLNASSSRCISFVACFTKRQGARNTVHKGAARNRLL